MSQGYTPTESGYYYLNTLLYEGFVFVEMKNRVVFLNRSTTCPLEELENCFYGPKHDYLPDSISVQHSGGTP